MTRIYNEWLKRIEARKASHAQIVNLCNMADGRGRRSLLRPVELAQLFNRHLHDVWAEGGGITPTGAPYDDEDANRVRANAYLARYMAKPGAVTVVSKPHGWIDMLDAARDGQLTFLWVGVDDTDMVPIWRAIHPNGDSMDYFSIPWQRKRYGR
jgi:hypothetical protein